MGEGINTSRTAVNDPTRGKKKGDENVRSMGESEREMGW
jgi:hypothetical protein